MILTDLNAYATEIGEQSLFEVRLPDAKDQSLDQDEAWCEVKLDGEWRKFRFHDYNEIYNVPGLYETIFYRIMRCCSPVRVVGLLEDLLRDAKQPVSDLRVLDVGAGNGMVGAALQDIGVNHIVGIDIIPEAKKATKRDRPWAYEDYHVADLTDLSEQVEENIRGHRPNVLTTVAALGYGDIPDLAFLKALDLMETPSWIAFNIKESFIDEADDNTGFSALIKRLSHKGIIKIHAYRRYCHRLSVAGEPLYYVAIVATKMKDIPDELLSKRPAMSSKA